MSNNVLEKMQQAKVLRQQLLSEHNRMQVTHEAAARQLREAEAESIAEFSTASLDELRAIGRDRDRHNHEVVDVFYKELVEVRDQLMRCKQASNV